MSNTKHTPGPWMADLRSGCCAVYPVSRKDDSNGLGQDQERNIFYSNKDSKYTDEHHWEMDEETQANAKLIAAAPELLEALQWLMDYPEDDLKEWADDSRIVTMTFPSGHIAKAVNAIKKATE